MNDTKVQMEFTVNTIIKCLLRYFDSVVESTEIVYDNIIDFETEVPYEEYCKIRLNNNIDFRINVSYLNEILGFVVFYDSQWFFTCGIPKGRYGENREDIIYDNLLNCDNGKGKKILSDIKNIMTRSYKIKRIKEYVK